MSVYSINDFWIQYHKNKYNFSQFPNFMKN